MDGPGVTFANLTADATIKIFTVTGDLVRRIDVTSADGGQKTWDGLNDDGGRAASGIYYYLVTAPNVDNRRGRLAIIR